MEASSFTLEDGTTITGKTIKVVAVENPDVGDWAAYSGSLHMTYEEIASNGYKLRPELAKALFPHIEGYYRL